MLSVRKTTRHLTAQNYVLLDSVGLRSIQLNRGVDMNRKYTPYRTVLIAFIFFMGMFIWTLFSKDELPAPKRYSYLIFMGIGNIFLGLSLIRDWKAWKLGGTKGSNVKCKD
jgi:hypothetical protein